ncbi:hypothetical protein P43SY_001286 [Pythium insidiosum]|uniref:Uncharacterized protein n=1 Tax=Pythium insidiosum TaxID=114742 RepID=A0AAD5LL03_PYTIN|nr:hypothetical protein P43SY_001286 [Pythium insidiosum]
MATAEASSARVRDRETFREFLAKHRYVPQGRYARVGPLEDKDLDAMLRGSAVPIWKWLWQNVKNAEDMDMIQRNVNVARYQIDSCKQEREEAKKRHEELLARKKYLQESLQKASEREKSLLSGLRRIESEQRELAAASMDRKQREVLRAAFNQHNEQLMDATTILLQQVCERMTTSRNGTDSGGGSNPVEILLEAFRQMTQAAQGGETVEFGESDIERVEASRKQKQDLDEKIELMNRFEERQDEIVSQIRQLYGRNQELIQVLTRKQDRLLEVALERDISEDRVSTIPNATALAAALDELSGDLAHLSLVQTNNVMETNSETAQRWLPELQQAIDNWREAKAATSMSGERIVQRLEAELKADTARKQSLLRSCGVEEEDLSKNGQMYLHVLSEVAELFKLRDVQMSSYLAAASALIERVDAVEQIEQALQQETTQSQRRSKDIADEFDDLRHVKERLRDATEEREKHENTVTMEQRTAEHLEHQQTLEQELSELEQKLQDLELPSILGSMDHHHIAALQQECVDIEAANEELRAQLRGFEGLPLDKDLAAAKLHEAQQELLRLEDDFNRRIRTMV